MTETFLEVPSLTELADLPVNVVPMDEPGVVAVTAHADDGDAVTITWDEFARSVTIRWMTSDVERVRVERELATRVSVIQNKGAIEFRSWMRTSDTGGQFLVRVADRVSLSDAILRM